MTFFLDLKAAIAKADDGTHETDDDAYEAMANAAMQMINEGVKPKYAKLGALRCLKDLGDILHGQKLTLTSRAKRVAYTAIEEDVRQTARYLGQHISGIKEILPPVQGEPSVLDRYYDGKY